MDRITETQQKLYRIRKTFPVKNEMCWDIKTKKSM